MERSRCSTVSSGSPDKKQRSQSRGKVRPDPVEDALDIKRRQQEAQRLLLEKRREKEMQECSFSPSISRESQKLAEANPYRRATPIHERTIHHVTHVWEDSTVTPKVVMNETSRVLAEKLPDRDVPIGERAAKQKAAFAERIKKEAEKKEEAQISEATHRPIIDKVSTKLVAQRQGAPDAFGRLTDEYVRKREEAREKVKREAEQERARQTSKPVFVNKHSERLLQQAADSGREVKGIDAGSKTPRTLARENSTRFDGDYSNGSSNRTPRSRSGQHSPRVAPKSATPMSGGRSSMARTMPASQSNRASMSRSPGSPDSPPSSLPPTTPRGRHSNQGATSRGGRTADTSQEERDKEEDDQIFAANPNSIGDSGSDIKWLARMAGKTGGSLRPSSARATSRSDGHSPPRSAGGFNPFTEMDKMRLEFQKLVKEKEDETKKMLEQLMAQRVDATNGELQEENERLRDDLESHIARVSELEAKLQEVDDDREQLRKANEKLRLDLEAITEKGQAVVELNAKLMVRIKALKSKESIVTHAQSSGKMKKDNRVSHVQSDSVNEEDIGSVRKYEVEKISSKQFAQFLDDSQESSPEVTPR